MKLSRRRFLQLGAGAAMIAPMPVLAQGYPARAVRIVSGFAAGGANDVMARLIGQSLSERLGHSFIIENRPGSAGNIATQFVVNSVADGYTLLAAGTPNAVNATLYKSLDFIRDVAPIVAVMRVPNILGSSSSPKSNRVTFNNFRRQVNGRANDGYGSFATERFSARVRCWSEAADFAMTRRATSGSAIRFTVALRCLA
jgi:tripartite-type tricarboxylate transporter receptor subunit TctC